MSFTNSPLKIELIQTGTQTGTWGNTTNVNLQALQEAISGSADIAFSSADVTLTLTNTNGTQAARHLRLNLTGTSGGARNLILGSGCQIDKPYIINNGLADTVTVKNTTGTGVAVPAGRSMWVFNNGVNVVDVTNHVSSLTLSTPLPVASGGTGQTSFTDGQLLIGNTSGNTLTKATLTGTANRLTVTDGAGSITLNVDAATANTANKVVARDASGNFSAGEITADLTGDVTGDVTGDLFGNADTATELETARTIGGVSFDGTANIDLPGVNIAGNQNTSGSSGSTTGNAATATTLQTSRSINGTNFNGSANINTETFVTGVNQNTDFSIMLLPSFAGVAGTYQAHAASAGPRYNPVSDRITATSFFGNATTATRLVNDAGSAPSFSARAWVNFNGTTNGIRDSGNVTSVTSSANGIFTLNFSTAMVDNDYVCVGSAGNGSATRFAGPITFNVSNVVVITESQDGSNTDFVDSNFVVFR